MRQLHDCTAADQGAFAVMVRDGGYWQLQLVCEGGLTLGDGQEGAGRLEDAPAGARLQLKPHRGVLMARGRGQVRMADGRPLDATPVRLPPGAVLRLGRAAVVVFALEPQPGGRARPVVRAGEAISASPAVWQAWASALLAAPTNWPVWIGGESGTGKELAARMIHDASPRADRPFVALSLATLPKELLHAELFGAQRGAYSGCLTDRAGAFARADGGTLLLDEIGEIDDATQVALLRVLESSEITPLGGSSRKVDVRLLVASHRDLADLVSKGQFRLDLFHRLAVCCVALPPLRSRGDDAATLLSRWLEQPLPRGSHAVIAAHSWPGNLRELRNVARRLEIALGGAPAGVDEIIAAVHAGRRWGTPVRPEPVAASAASAPDVLPSREDRRQRVAAALAAGGPGSAWRRSGLSRSTFFRLARELREPIAC